MLESINWEVILGVMAVFGFISGVWRRFETKMKIIEETATLRALSAQAKAEAALADLSAYKLHVAEKYATREGVEREFQEIIKSITQLGVRVENRLDGVSERLDRVIEANLTAKSSTK